MKIILSLLTMMLFACVQNTPAPLGEACETQEDCASNLCANLNGGICTQLCDSVNPCPTNYECTPTSGVESVCIPIDVKNNTMDAGTQAGSVSIGATQGGTSVAGSQGGSSVAGSQGGSSVAGSQGGSSSAGSTSTTELSCIEIIDCINQCPETTIQTCAQDCLSQGSTDGANQVIALSECINNQCPQGDQNCIQTQCSNEISTCESGTTTTNPPTPSGQTLDCKGLLICLSICQDQACQNNCASQATQEGLQTYDAVANCYQTNQCQDEACLDMNCATEYQACVPPVNLSCADALNCLLACDQNDEICQYSCYLDAQDSAVTPLNDYLGCLNMQQCDSLDCAACSTQASACNM